MSPRRKRPYRVVLAAVAVAPNHDATLPLAYLKTYAEKHRDLGPGRVRTEIMEWLLSAAGADAVAAEILSRKPDLVGLSCYLWNIKIVSEIVRRIKEASPKTLVVLGGPEVWLDPADVLRRLPADFVAYGEAEETWVELLRRLLARRGPEGVKGMAFRRAPNAVPEGGGHGAPVRERRSPEEETPAGQLAQSTPRRDGVVLTPPRPPLAELDSIPSPFLAGLLRFDRPEFRGGIFETSRGCPFDCAYCMWLGERGRMRYFSEDRLRREVRAIVRRTKGRTFFVADADLFMNRPRAKRILRIFEEEDPRAELAFTFETNFVYFDDEMARLSNRKGYYFRVGLQSTNRDALEAAHRKFDLARFKRGFESMKRHAPECTVGLELILGMPGDTYAGFRRSLDWMLDLGADEYYVYHLMVFPGTGYAREAESHGLRCEPEAPHLVISHRTFPAEDIARARELLFWITLLFGTASVRAVLEYVRKARPKAGGIGALCGSLAASIEAEKAYPVERAFRRWEQGRPTGVFVLTAERPGDESDRSRRSVLLPAVARWARRKRSLRPVDRGRISRFLEAAANRVRWEEVARGPAMADLARSLAREAPKRGGTLLICWARDWEMYEAMDERPAGMVVLSEDKHDVDVVANTPLPIKDVIRVGARPRTPVRPALWGKGYGRVVLSNTYGSLPEQKRVPWLASLRKSCVRGARLAVLDDFMGCYPLEISSFGRPDRKGALKALLKGLKAAGWKLEGEPCLFARREGAEWTMVRAKAV